MAGVTTNGAVALVALLSMLVPAVHSAVDYGISAARSYNAGWLPAKATWYGQPNGAGPDDNGNKLILNVLASRSSDSSVVSSNNGGRSINLQVVLAASRT
jgi:hypothetical protein